MLSWNAPLVKPELSSALRVIFSHFRIPTRLCQTVLPQLAFPVISRHQALTCLTNVKVRSSYLPKSVLRYIYNRLTQELEREGREEPYRRTSTARAGAADGVAVCVAAARHNAAVHV